MDLDNILVTKRDKENTYEKSYGSQKSPDYVKNLRQFGEIGFIMQRNKKITSKISNCGKKGIMVGYAKQSTYRMFNLGTNKVTNTKKV